MLNLSTDYDNYSKKDSKTTIVVNSRTRVRPNIMTLTKKAVFTFNPLTSRPGCMPGSRYTSVGVLFFVI